MKTIIFLSGLGVPKWLAKTKYIWNDKLWKDYNKIYITSKIPYSNNMVERELNDLTNLVKSFSKVIIAGQSIGAWWTINLLAHTNIFIYKSVLLTPLIDITDYPISNITPKYHLINRKVYSRHTGKNNSLLIEAKNDWITPRDEYSLRVEYKLNPTVYTLNGGHIYQKDHQEGLSFMKEWIDKV